MRGEPDRSCSLSSAGPGGNKVPNPVMLAHTLPCLGLRLRLARSTLGRGPEFPLSEPQIPRVQGTVRMHSPEDLSSEALFSRQGGGP